MSVLPRKPLSAVLAPGLNSFQPVQDGVFFPSPPPGRFAPYAASLTNPSNPANQPAPPKLDCRHCGALVDVCLRWKPATNGHLHLAAYCRICEKWIRFVPQDRHWLPYAPALRPAALRSAAVPSPGLRAEA